MKNMTVKQLASACEKYPYILARFRSGHVMGINTGVARIARLKKPYKDSDITDFVSYAPCDFQEYISFKHPFVVLPTTI